MVRTFLAALLAVCALLPAGCCSLARLACDWPIERTPPGNRRTPDAAIDFLIEAFRNRSTADLYESFHPDFVAENGKFSQSEFAVAYGKAEAEFAADAESMASAARHWREPRADGWVVVELTNPSTGAFFPIALVNRPKIRIATKDPFVPTIEGTVPMHGLVGLENGRLTLPASFELTSIENVERQTVAGLTGADIVRVEFSDDWVVRAVDTEHAKNIRFLVKIKEYAGK